MTKQEKILLICIIDKVLIFLIYWKLSKLKSRKRPKIDRKMGKGHEQKFVKTYKTQNSHYTYEKMLIFIHNKRNVNLKYTERSI